jgi:hypothetical protein
MASNQSGRTKGTFYPDACRWAHLEHRVYPLEWKNQIERMNQALMKDRLENFDDLFPCLKEGCDRGHVSNWISVFFRVFLNLRRQDDGPEYQRFIRTLSQGLS